MGRSVGNRAQDEAVTEGAHPPSLLTRRLLDRRAPRVLVGFLSQCTNFLNAGCSNIIGPRLFGLFDEREEARHVQDD